MEKKLHAAILAVMEEVKYLKNDKQVGTGTSGYKSISDEKVREVLQRAFVRNRLTVMQTGIEQSTQIDRWETLDYNGKPATKQQLTLTAVVTYKITHADTGESEYLQSVGIGVDPQDKSAGKAMTYALKYALLNLFLIPTGEDSDQFHSEEMPVAPPKTKPVLNQQSTGWAKALEAAKNGTYPKDKMLQAYTVSESDLQILYPNA
jgi:hypothetical protein